MSDKLLPKRKMLIFAHYYAPDTASTGQILKDQAEGMSEEYDVTVICTVPSYSGIIEKKYKTQKYFFEQLNGVKIIRVRVPEFIKENKLSRIKNILAYFWGALRVSSKTGKQDYIFTISQPPILGGLLGVFGKWRKKAKLIYCIQDFNPEQIVAVNYISNNMIIKVMAFLDKFSCIHSDLVITVGRDLVETLKNRFHNRIIPNYKMINNWIDEKEIFPLPVDDIHVAAFRKKYGLDNKFIIMYSGNIGLYYDLENIIKVIEKIKPGVKTFNGKEVIFVFVGGGCILNELKDYVCEHHMENVIFIPYQDKEKLIYSLNAADVHWCVNSKGMKGVSCPSKFYGIVAVAKPILGVLEADSEIGMLIRETSCGLVCEPGDYEQIEKNIRWFIENAETENIAKMGERGHEFLIDNLTKDKSIKKYIEAIRFL